MKFSIASAFMAAMTAAELVAAAPLEPRAPNVSYFSGFNIGANKPNGDCKSTQDWIDEFNKIKSWSSEFTTVKLFSTSDCWALANAVPAAKATGLKIWAGVWAVDRAKFEREKAALEQAIKDHGTDWLVGINVGSESLYRKEIHPGVLTEQIWDVKGMVQIAHGASHIAVGSADTWTSWVDGANADVVRACDVVVMNAFPYWQGAPVDDAQGVFQTAIDNTKAAIGEGKQLIIGETGWPTGGPDFGSAHPSVENLQKYYKSTGCSLRTSKTPHFWFSTFDEPNRTSDIEKNFGIATSDRNLKIDITC
ncbi:Glycoside Hydrolase Family 17 protein [Tuber magnatum]|uniref:glucan 1,3-beta-glucosidase n=1 Tax=Tuber magnatum TaxID=42249 RepID=A0A317SW75_9PEZI|nr:Glycoside Hydrolase Family 17 protein [Tuber magnatum]